MLFDHLVLDHEQILGDKIAAKKCKSEKGMLIFYLFLIDLLLQSTFTQDSNTVFKFCCLFFTRQLVRQLLCMEFNKGIILFLLTVSYFFNYGKCSGETCYSLSDGEMNHSGYCSTSCKHGTLVPSAKCRKFRQSPMCCLPRLKRVSNFAMTLYKLKHTFLQHTLLPHFTTNTTSTLYNKHYNQKGSPYC